MKIDTYLIQYDGELYAHPFFVNELDKSYSFRGIAPYIDLQRNGYEDVYREMRDQELSFFRVRTKKEIDKTDISKLTHIVHLPYAMKGSASNMRFSRVGCPCLYLGTTTYVCCKECGWDASNEEMFAASFTPNEQGKKLRILNLTVSQALINGIYHKGIDDSKDKEKQYSSICDKFNISLPIKFGKQDAETKKSYINSIYKKADKYGMEKYISKTDVDGNEIYYGDTKYGKFDNYLVSQSRYKFESREIL